MNANEHIHSSKHNGAHERCPFILAHDVVVVVVAAVAAAAAAAGSMK